MVCMIVCGTGRYKATDIYEMESRDTLETWYGIVLSEDLQIQQTTIRDIMTIPSTEFEEELYPRITVINKTFHPLHTEEDRT